LLTFGGALSFLIAKPAPTALLFIDDLNIVFIAVNTSSVYDERLQRDVYRARNRHRPLDIHTHPFLPRDVPDHDVSA